MKGACCQLGQIYRLVHNLIFFIATLNNINGNRENITDKTLDWSDIQFNTIEIKLDCPALPNSPDIKVG